jgi:hypothetical protein
MFGSILARAAAVVVIASLAPSVAVAQSAAEAQCEFEAKDDDSFFIGHGHSVALAGQKVVYNSMPFTVSQEPPAKIISVKVMPGCTAGVTSNAGASEYSKDSRVNLPQTIGLYCVCK